MNNQHIDILYLNKDDVDSICTYKDVVAAVEEAFYADGMGQMYVPSKEVMRVGPDRANCIFPMPGYLENLNTAGVKWTNFYPKQPDDYPTIWAHILILSYLHNGMPYAVMDATTITNMRTAGGHAVVAAKHLAKKSSKVLSILGCGAQGRSAMKSFDENFELDLIKVYNIEGEYLEKCKKEMPSQVHTKIEFVDSPQELMEDADILLSATTSRTPLVKAEWIPKGCLVDAMFAFNDIDPRITHLADKWVLGNYDSDRIEILEHPNFRDKIDENNVYASLGEIVCKKVPGRESDEEIIVFSHMGMGTLDIAVGNRLVTKAKKLGLGKILRLT